jgi:hypothetical protein
MVVDGVHLLRLLGLRGHALGQGLDLSRAACVLIVVALLSPHAGKRHVSATHTHRHTGRRHAVSVSGRALKQVRRSIISELQGSTRFLLYVLSRGAPRVSEAESQVSVHSDAPGVDPQLLHNLARHFWRLRLCETTGRSIRAAAGALTRCPHDTSLNCMASPRVGGVLADGVFLWHCHAGKRPQASPLASAHGAVNVSEGKESAVVRGASTTCRPSDATTCCVDQASPRYERATHQPAHCFLARQQRQLAQHRRRQAAHGWGGTGAAHQRGVGQAPCHSRAPSPFCSSTAHARDGRQIPDPGGELTRLLHHWLARNCGPDSSSSFYGVSPLRWST